MQSDTLEVGQVFENRQQYLVPYYQRSYTWSIGDQLEGLWEDIADKAQAQLAGGKVAPHFLGAVVLEPQPREGLRGVNVLHIVDGQQRLTTLQFVLAALQLAFAETGSTGFEENLASYLVNGQQGTMKNPEVERFKVWPTHRDREAFKKAMTASSLHELRVRFANHFANAGHLLKYGDHPPALAAIWYFADRAKEFIETSEAGKLEAAEALLMAVVKHFKIVAITLQEDDDAQVIFETLNAKGAQLNAVDLVRNFIFMRADRESDQAHELYDTLWSRFEDERWSHPQKRGRLTKPRLEWMLQSVLQVERQREVEVSRLYAEYRVFANAVKNPLGAEDQLRLLNRYADHYEALSTGEGTRPIARFGMRIAGFDVTTIYPLALQVSAAGLDDATTRSMFNDLMSYVVRRALCGLTAKNYNNLFMAALRHLAKEGVTAENLRSYLASQTSEIARWPRDGEVRHACLTGDVFYGRLKPAAARQLLTEIEAAMRSTRRTEEPELPKLSHLDVDHIMPRSWYAYWPLSDGSSAAQEEAEQARALRRSGEALTERQMEILGRDDLTPTLGNITLLNLSANRAASNKDFSTKKAIITADSNLSLNMPLITATAWDVAQIQLRGEELVRVVLGLYPSPE